MLARGEMLRHGEAAMSVQIPGDDGWPFVGNTLAIIADHRRFVEGRSRRFGMVYRTERSAMPT